MSGHTVDSAEYGNWFLSESVSMHACAVHFDLARYLQR